jgi:threonine synthase
MRYLATHRSEFMWPWESEPRSVAHGILDDETYDWLAVVAGMADTGGRPLVVDEATLIEANDLAGSATGIDADHTGTAGLAGLIDLVRRGDVREDETVAVIFTGIRRAAEAAPDRPALERSAP